MRAPAHIKLPTIPLTANHYAVLVDATRVFGQYEANGTTAPSVGQLRGHPAYVAKRVRGTCQFNQAVTVLFKILVNGAWETDADAPDGGSKALALNTKYPFNYLPQGIEYAIWILAGATPPTAGFAQCDLIEDAESGA